MKYPSIQNLYASNGIDGKGRESGPEFGFSNPAFGQIANWVVTEKVDGTNIRVILDNTTTLVSSDGQGNTRWDVPHVEVRGRTDNANLPADLLFGIQKWATLDTLRACFDDGTGEIPDHVTLYGEGFGPGIQKAGQAYGGNKRFILFDVKVGEWWLNWDSVKDIANKLGVPHVTQLGWCSLEEAKARVRESSLLPQGSEHIEGIVCRTDPYLFDQWGNRVMFKYKIRDLKEGE